MTSFVPSNMHPNPHCKTLYIHSLITTFTHDIKPIDYLS